MASTLVLGGAGFLGSHLAEALLQGGHRVKIFDRPHLDRLPLLPEQRFELFTGDFLNGTLRLVELCRQHGVRKIVFVSSGGTVYGVSRSIPLDESHPTDPICSYGIHKLAIEKYLCLSHRLHGLDYCIVRPSNLYGPRQRLDVAQGAVAVFLDRASRGKPIQVWGDGSVVRDYVYVEDAAEALLKAAAFEGEQKIFNIGSGVGTSLKALIEAIEALLGHPVPVEYGAPRSLDVPANVLDTSLARRHLGWSARTPLAEGLRRTHASMHPPR